MHPATRAPQSPRKWPRDYDAMMQTVTGTAARVPIRFGAGTDYLPISMTWRQVDAYRRAVRDACGYAQIDRLRTDDVRAYWCDRQ
jgi:hypothetical protein